MPVTGKPTLSFELRSVLVDSESRHPVDAEQIFYYDALG